MYLSDEDIRHRARLEPAIVPDKFNERSDALLGRLSSLGVAKKAVRLKPVFRFVIAAVLLIIVLIGGAYAAYTLSGGEYFKEVFKAKASQSAGKNYGYMNTDQLTNMQSSTVGRVVDTPDLSIDVLGVLVSGNTARYDVKVTAKKLETVLYDTGIEPLMNYRFHDDGNFCLLENGQRKVPRGTSGTIQHIYSDKDTSLAPNQFIIRYSYVSEVPLKGQTYIMTYKDFGYFDFSKLGQFQQIYTGEWSFNIVFDPADDTSRRVTTGQHLAAGQYEFIVDSVEITPLTCTVKISNAKEYFDRLDSRWMDVSKILYDKTTDFTVNLADGTRLDSSQYDGSGTGGGASGYSVVATFKVPITVSDVVSVTLGGTEIPLK